MSQSQRKSKKNIPLQEFEKYDDINLHYRNRVVNVTMSSRTHIHMAG